MTQYTAKTINDYQHQYLRVAAFPFTYKDAKAAGAPFLGPVIQLPPGAVPIAGALKVTTAFNTGTTATVKVGTSGSTASLLAATDLKTAASTNLTLPAYSASAGNFGLTFALVGTDATAGDGVVYITYIQMNGGDFSVGNDAETNL